jgi:hypothetical protein
MIPRYGSDDFTARALLLEHLEVAKAHVAGGERSIAHQKQVIDRLSRAKLETTTAHEVLRALETSQVLYEAHRDRIERQLAAADQRKGLDNSATPTQ